LQYDAVWFSKNLKVSWSSFFIPLKISGNCCTDESLAGGGLVCCSVLQCLAVCCRLLQIVADCCRLLQCDAVCCSMLQYVAVWCVAVCCSVLQCRRVFDCWWVCVKHTHTHTHTHTNYTPPLSLALSSSLFLVQKCHTQPCHLTPKRGGKAGEKSKWQDVMSSYSNLRNTETTNRNTKWNNSERLNSHCSLRNTETTNRNTKWNNSERLNSHGSMSCVTRGMLSHKNLKEKEKKEKCCRNVTKLHNTCNNARHSHVMWPKRKKGKTELEKKSGCKVVSSYNNH